DVELVLLLCGCVAQPHVQTPYMRTVHLSMSSPMQAVARCISRAWFRRLCTSPYGAAHSNRKPARVEEMYNYFPRNRPQRLTAPSPSHASRASRRRQASQGAADERHQLLQRVEVHHLP